MLRRKVLKWSSLELTLFRPLPIMRFALCLPCLSSTYATTLQGKPDKKTGSRACWFESCLRDHPPCGTAVHRGCGTYRAGCRCDHQTKDGSSGNGLLGIDGTDEFPRQPSPVFSDAYHRVCVPCPRG